MLLSHEAQRDGALFDSAASYSLCRGPHVLTKEEMYWLPITPYNNLRQLPLCDSRDGEFVARHFGNRFRLLTIYASQVQNISYRKHPCLPHGEFFGEVPHSAVLEDTEYIWEKVSNPAQVPQSFIDHYKSYGGWEEKEKMLRYIPKELHLPELVSS
jgi:hypothetical protein